FDGAAAQRPHRRANQRAGMRKGLLAMAAVLAVSLALREDDFALLLLTRVLIVILACLGLNVQFGYAGVVNFAGATFFGVGGYTAAVLARATGLPHLLILRSEEHTSELQSRGHL